jgi:SAM-dependent methyltransferase
MFTPIPVTSARTAYDVLAPHYDEFTRGQHYAAWTAGLVALAQAHGLDGKRLLDAGCGTGKSFMPLLRMGFTVTGCDLSDAMLARARHASQGAADLHHADVRDLPCLGRHDLAWALCDVANYLLTETDLAAMAAGLRRNLRPGGIALFDCSTVRAYKDFFGSTRTVELPGRHLTWHGGTDPAEFAPGDHAAAVLHAFTETEAGHWTRTTSRHLQRHHPRPTVDRALAGAGLEVAAVYGQTHDLRFDTEVDEERHDKAIYVAVNPRRGGDAT